MKVRILSALIAAAIVVPFIIIGKIPFAVGVGIAALLGFKEIIDLKKSHNPIPILMIIISAALYLVLIYCNVKESSILWGISYSRIILLTLCLIIPTIFYSEEKYNMKDAFFLVGVLLFLGMGFNSFIIIRNMSQRLFWYLVTIPACTDSFALFIGLAIGKHKMSPKISPKKSWEGAIGGLIFGTVIPCVFYHFLVGQITIKVVIITALLSIFGQIGDLIFSKIKRENGIKDFSNLMPGHGGALDRLDSTLVIFMAYLLLISLFY